MQLRSSPSSPFGRKVKMATYILGFDDQVTPVLTDTLDPNDSICDVNPLGKIPALEDDGTTYYDSRVIMEYLDAKAGGGKIIPASGPTRYEALTRAALMDGILDAAILVIYERRMRPEDKYVESVVERQRGKIIRGLEAIAAENRSYSNGAMPDVGEIGLACVLDYLDFRKQVNWRDHAPNLASWLADFAAAVPGYEDSMPPID
ncbi:glutathione S-transferase family protein [Alphaproteobacteria bacterium]|jgi:glutathione S-transferase|nr:glutathione S-transferase family protein [Alphaproteobacteria bacterium]MDA8648795.1 glutathione S-transferase family protein [Alphaproteobacteria bacterium]MDA9897931.1 glutathione S-transferase family protein [Alphaproteobacteria bacterium]MDB2638316.1 glutathione S-transferase family protein [Alphaproteobacteria bacterium]MDC0493119.1 glutathione S-transferase family protein [Alphaproteobacteria bacterium]